MDGLVQFLHNGGWALYVVLLASLALCLATWKRSAAYVAGGWVAVVLFVLLVSEAGEIESVNTLNDMNVDAMRKAMVFATGLARTMNVSATTAFMAWIGGLVMTARAMRESRGQPTVSWLVATPLLVLVPFAFTGDDFIKFMQEGGRLLYVAPLFAALGAWTLARRPEAADQDRDLWVGMAASLPTAAVASTGHIFGNINAWAMTASDQIEAGKKYKILAAASADAMNNTALAGALLLVGLLPLALATRALPARGPALVAGYATGVLIGLAGALFGGFGPHMVTMGMQY